MIIVNGKLEDKVFIDEGFMFGLGAFETIFVNKGPVFLKEHINRLNDTLDALAIGRTISCLEVEKIIEDYKINHCALKIVVTQKNIIYTTRPLHYKEAHYKNGFKVTISNFLRYSNRPLSLYKTLNYGDLILEKRRALENGFDEAVFFNEKGFLTEGTLSNLFFIKNKKIYTPDITCGILNGIVRQWIINHFPVYEGTYRKEDLLSSDSVFITNSLMGIMKVSSLDNIIFENHPMIEGITRRYKEYIERKISL